MSRFKAVFGAKKPVIAMVHLGALPGTPLYDPKAGVEGILAGAARDLDALQAAGIEVLSAESTMVSSMTVEVTDADDARKILRIIDALEDNDDVQDVYSNFDISDELMEAVGE